MRSRRPKTVGATCSTRWARGPRGSNTLWPSTLTPTSSPVQRLLCRGQGNIGCNQECPSWTCRTCSFETLGSDSRARLQGSGRIQRSDPRRLQGWSCATVWHPSGHGRVNPFDDIVKVCENAFDSVVRFFCPIELGRAFVVPRWDVPHQVNLFASSPRLRKLGCEVLVHFGRVWPFDCWTF